jgi:hypothetical protein
MSTSNSEARKRSAVTEAVVTRVILDGEGKGPKTPDEFLDFAMETAYETWKKNQTLRSAVKALKSVCVVMQAEYPPDDPYTLMLNQAVDMATAALEESAD